MSLPEKRLLRSDRVRQLPEQFSWIDRAFIRRGLIDGLCTDAVALYFFLIAVGDRHGLSFYSDRRLAELLSMDAERLQRARRALVQQDLVAYSYPLYQVLSLPLPAEWAPTDAAARSGGLQSLRQVFGQLGQHLPQEPLIPGGRHDG